MLKKTKIVLTLIAILAFSTKSSFSMQQNTTALQERRTQATSIVKTNIDTFTRDLNTALAQIQTNSDSKSLVKIAEELENVKIETIQATASTDLQKYSNNPIIQKILNAKKQIILNKQRTELLQEIINARLATTNERLQTDINLASASWEDMLDLAALADEL